MAGFAKIYLLGNIGKVKELKETKSGESVLNFSVAASYGEDKVEWTDVVAFGKTAENCAKFLSKGDKVHVEGRKQTREYEKDGTTFRAVECVANSVQFLTPKSEKKGKAKTEEADEPETDADESDESLPGFP